MAKGLRVSHLLGLFFVISIAAFAYGAQPRPNGCSAPMWSTDVIQNLGPNRVAPFLEDRDRAGLTFLDNKQLVVHEVDVDTGRLSSRQSADIGSPFRLRAAVLDADSGMPVFTREWGTRVRDSSILVSSGGILVRTGEELRLLSRDFVEFRKWALPHPNPSEGWELRVSASRQTVLVNYYNQEWKRKLNVSRFEVLDGKTLDTRLTWTESPALHMKLYSVSDIAIAIDDHLHTPEHIFVSQFGSKKWEPVWQKSERYCASSAVLALVTDNSFVYACKEFSFVSRGQVLMSERFDKGEHPVQAKLDVTQDGRFVAISLERIKGGSLDTERHTAALQIAVYDLYLKKRILTVDIAPLPRSDFDFALSPNGSKLAILNDRKASVCSVPLQPIAH